MKPTRVKHSGVAFEFGDEQLIVPPLTVGQVESLTPILVSHDQIKVEDYTQITERLKLRVKVIHEALKRNYSEITESEVTEFVTGENSEALLSAALGTDRKSPRIKTVGENQPVSA